MTHIYKCRKPLLLFFVFQNTFATPGPLFLLVPPRDFPHGRRFQPHRPTSNSLPSYCLEWRPSHPCRPPPIRPSLQGRRLSQPSRPRRLGTKRRLQPIRSCPSGPPSLLYSTSIHSFFPFSFKFYCIYFIFNILY